MSRVLSPLEAQELAALLGRDLVEFFSDAKNWQAAPLRPAPGSGDALMRVALTIAAQLAPVCASARGLEVTPAQLDDVTTAAALYGCERARARFGGRAVWVDSAAGARRREAERVIAEAMQTGRPLVAAFDEAGVSRATGYRIRDRLLGRR
ncbi:MAG: hypothetical protein MUF03_14360 [Rubrivivax sp.]|nr:hypothetical protein [Rubrivivax sp.]